MRIGNVCLTADRKDNSTSDELRKKLFSIWEFQGKIWNKNLFHIYMPASPPPLSFALWKRKSKERRQ